MDPEDQLIATAIETMQKLIPHLEPLASRAMLKERDERIAELEAALADMVYQFAGWHDSKGGYMTNGLSALEGAFATLCWDEPHICKEAQCDEPGCKKQRTCGWPSDRGYRNTCSEHWPKERPQK